MTGRRHRRRDGSITVARRYHHPGTSLHSQSRGLVRSRRSRSVHLRGSKRLRRRYLLPPPSTDCFTSSRPVRARVRIFLCFFSVFRFFFFFTLSPSLRPGALARVLCATYVRSAVHVHVPPRRGVNGHAGQRALDRKRGQRVRAGRGWASCVMCFAGSCVKSYVRQVFCPRRADGRCYQIAAFMNPRTSGRGK